MTDLAPDTSTVLDAEPLGGPSGGGELPPEPKAPSLQETITAAMKETPKEEAAEPGKDADTPKDEKAPEKGTEKPEEGNAAPEAKDAKKPAERAPDGKFAAKQTEDADAKPDAEAKPEAKPNGHIEPPAKFLPDAKEKWLNTPRPVQRDVANLAREHEAEVTKYREAAERYEPIRQFDEVARQHGRAGAHESLAEVAQLEDLMGKNPLAALNQILLRAGPRKADGQPVSFYEMAQAVVQMGPQGYQRAVSQTQQDNQQRGPDPEVARLRADMARMQEQTLTATVIEPFKRDHPRYDELKTDIALFLQSGKISRSLSPQERLEAAYDMAVRINPASHAPASDLADPEPGERAVDDLSGRKSIKSAPGAVSPDLEPDRGGSTHEIVMQELRRLSRK